MINKIITDTSVKAYDIREIINKSFKVVKGI